mgnify:CR=1 FL=1
MADVKILGAGLAGCEAALWLAEQGHTVDLYEQKPHAYSPAHKQQGFAELVCSNSLKSDRLDSAAGLLKEEMRRLGSHLLAIAAQCSVAAGGALAVDRNEFSRLVTEAVEQCPNITIHRQEVTEIAPHEGITLVATGPLTKVWTWKRSVLPPVGERVMQIISTAPLIKRVMKPFMKR